MTSRTIFITGGTGYIGSRLVSLLQERGHTVRVLVRPQSRSKLPEGCTVVTGDALDASTYSRHVAPADTFIHLVGVPHPGPAKAQQFETIDLVSVREAVTAATDSGIKHFIYLSVAQPAPVMTKYQEVRKKGEEMIAASGMNATFVRPWYVLGPGHWWPLAFAPLYWICERIPATREQALRLGLVTIGEMLRTLVTAVEVPATGTRVIDVAEIRRNGKG